MSTRGESLGHIMAESALSAALNNRGTMTQRQIAETLIGLADSHPSVLEDEITRLERRIALLRDYLPSKRPQP